MLKAFIAAAVTGFVMGVHPAPTLKGLRVPEIIFKQFTPPNRRERRLKKPTSYPTICLC